MFEEEKTTKFLAEVDKLKRNLDQLDEAGKKKYAEAIKKQKSKLLKLLEEALNNEVFLPYVVMAHSSVADECAKFAQETVDKYIPVWIDLTINNPDSTALLSKMEEAREVLYSYKAKLEIAHRQEVAKDPLDRYKIA